MTDEERASERAKALEEVLDAHEQYKSCRARYDRVLSELSTIVECVQRKSIRIQGESFYTSTPGPSDRRVPFPSRREVVTAVQGLVEVGRRLRSAKKRLADTGLDPDDLQKSLRESGQ